MTDVTVRVPLAKVAAQTPPPGRKRICGQRHPESNHRCEETKGHSGTHRCKHGDTW